MLRILSTQSLALYIFVLVNSERVLAFAPLKLQSHTTQGKTAFSSEFSELDIRDGVSTSTSLNLDTTSLALLEGTPMGSVSNMISTYAQEGGPLVMVLAAAITDSVPLVPTQPISIIAGAVFGLKMGLASIVGGQLLATIFTMAFGRYVLSERGWNAMGDEEDPGKLQKVLDELTSGLNSDDWKQVFLAIFFARQSPVLPFSLGNYFVGAATKAPLVPAVAATVLGCLPLSIVWVGAGVGGMAAVEMVQNNGMLGEGLEIAGAGVTLTLVGFLVKTILKVWNEDEAVVSE